MTILRYITFAVLGPFGALLVVMALVSSVMQLSRLGEVAFGALSDLAVFIRLSAYVAPTLAGVTLPVALLLSTLIAYDRLSDSGELFAFAASGVSSRRLFGPTAVVALPVAIISLLAALYAVPWGIGSFLDEMAALATRSFSQTLKPRAFTEILGTTALYANEVDPKRSTWRGVFLAHAPANVERQLLLFAPEISVVPEAEQRAAVLSISKGQTLLLGAGPEIVERITFGRGEGRLDLSSWAHQETAIYYDYQGHGLLQLLDDLTDEERPRHRRKIAFFMWQKLALPFACFPLALIGALLGAGRSADRRARSYVWGVILAVLFFIGHEGARGLAIQGYLSPPFAAWAAVLAATFMSILLWSQRAGLRQ